MNTRPINFVSRPSGLAGGTIRALSSALLLLGLISDRRAR